MYNLIPINMEKYTGITVYDKTYWIFRGWS